jgi:diguanylate cyclase (GGDEF)-like protein
VVQKVLVVDDEIDSLLLTSSMLEEWYYEVTTTTNGPDALVKARRELPDLILLDVHLGDMNGPEVCERLRACYTTRLIPIIMLTVDDEVLRKIEGLGKGADDYIIKTADPLELRARIETVIRRTQEQANVNPLTKLPGNLVIEQSVQKRLQNEELFSFCYCDLDNFKAFNDRYGYSAGDRVITHTAQILMDVVDRMGNPGDFVGHIGGDDFVLVTTPDREKRLCNEIMKTLDRTILGFYEPEDLEQECIEVKGRGGSVKSFPIMSITIAAVNNRGKSFESSHEIAERAAEIKTHLKRMEGSNFLSDRRTAAQRRRSKARAAS